jgi:hypothetical protein
VIRSADSRLRYRSAAAAAAWGPVLYEGDALLAALKAQL